MNKLVNCIEFLFQFIHNVLELSKIDRGILYSFQKVKFIFNECNIIIWLEERKKDGTFYSVIESGEPICIMIRKNLEKEKLWTVLLHEVGHLKDCEVLKEQYWRNQHSMKQTKKREKMAWKYALSFSKKYKLPIQLDFAIECLGSYDNAKSAFLMKEHARNLK